ncbi:hypothetical protein HPP92_009394 [Vanilla planifolia]|uniref:Thioredoxin domain-containing protein n=1 Tax=Vanilla planifolia TaxID=51239 RepID=A0A835V4N9_VANPL|nr:hypothetical protein HPP92_009394 [Vanilla planifolia]
MGEKAKHPLLCWRWPWDASPQPENPNTCGTLDMPWLFKSLQSLGWLARTRLFNLAAVYPGDPSVKARPQAFKLPVASKLSHEDQGEAEQRALASALAGGKEATVIEFYSPRCRLCNSLLHLVLEVEARNSEWVSFVLVDAENEKWLPEIL